MSVCLVNIGPRQRRRRVIGGAAWLIVAVGAMTLVLLQGVGLPWRLAVFFPTLFAAVCLLQVHEKTCVFLAAAGQRNLDTGNERVTDKSERRLLQRQAWRVMLRAIAVAAVATLVVALL